jgi:hypothetical protein
LITRRAASQGVNGSSVSYLFNVRADERCNGGLSAVNAFSISA